MRSGIILGIVVVGTALPLALVTLPHPAKTDGANGTFANDCCGTIRLSDGEMLLNDGQTVRYTVARDSNGPYLLPKVYVGAVPDKGLEMDGTRSVLKLRLDRLPDPTSITIYEGASSYVLTRQSPRASRIALQAYVIRSSDPTTPFHRDPRRGSAGQNALHREAQLCGYGSLRCPDRPQPYDNVVATAG